MLRMPPAREDFKASQLAGPQFNNGLKARE
jgi:hypothetical protein